MINQRRAESGKFIELDSNTYAVRVGNKDSEPLLVDIASGSLTSETINQFGTTVIASGNTQNIVQYTVPSGKKLELELIEYGSENISTFTVEIDSVIEARKRTWFNQSLSGEFFFNKLNVDENITITLYAENFRPSSANFEGRIMGVLDDKS